MTAALALGTGMAAAKPPQKVVDWPKLNPAFAGATFVNDATTCAACHEDAVRVFDHTIHAKALGHAEADANKCESCHGPRSKHVENPTDELALGKLTAPQQAQVCLQCHEGGPRFGWKAGPHQAADVSCTSCHLVMKNVSERSLLAKPSAAATCVQCHGEVRAATMKASHRGSSASRSIAITARRIRTRTV